jgi:hypothetical protein
LDEGREDIVVANEAAGEGCVMPLDGDDGALASLNRGLSQGLPAGARFVVGD